MSDREFAEQREARATRLSKLLALIPARGGSKGIPRKNVRNIAGKPLIGWTIEAALEAQVFDRVVVSTEDAEIGEVARALGAETPFLRPTSLAADDTPGIDPVLHALRELPEFDAVVLLQPTSPLRTSADIRGVIAMAAARSVPSVVSICEPDAHPGWMYRNDDSGRLVPWEDRLPAARRQDLEPVFSLNGAIYYAQCNFVHEHRTLVGPETIGYLMPAERSVDIDTDLDWQIAELLLENRIESDA